MDNIVVMIKRKNSVREINLLLKEYPVVALLGPRQTGKTTIARQLPYDEFFDLENPRDLARLDTPQLTLEGCSGLIVIDEVQRKPDLFPLLRYLSDTQKNQRYLLLGSASLDLVRYSSETLAGRIAFYYLGGFTKEEVGPESLNKLWLRGGLPPSFLSQSNEKSFRWRQNYFQTYIERDLPDLGVKIPPATLRKFWQMVSHYHANIVNFSDLGRSFGISDTTARRYIELLEGTYLVRSLSPWFVNIGKRLVKRPKIYIRDSGLYHHLLNTESFSALQLHPRLGASWEGFSLETVCGSIHKPDNSFCFWATHNGAEVDLFWQHDGKNWACEFKFADAPKMTRSMSAALESLNLEKMWVVYPGKISYQIHEKIKVVPLKTVPIRWNYQF